MKTSYNYAHILAAVVVLSFMTSCGHHEADQSTPINNPTVSFEKEDTCISNVTNQRFQDCVILRQPDKQVKAIKGHALLIETEGFCLMAADTAVMRSETYSVTSLYDDELPPMPQEMVNMTGRAAGYRLLPGGEHFAPYAEMRMSYDPARLPMGFTADDIYTSYYDTISHVWVRLERVEVDTTCHEIVSLTTHFTDFINELLRAPEMPETQAFVPTAMSDLEVVSPMDGILLATPPEANNEGTANLSYPLWIPAGRANMQPNLTLSYSSSGGNGWLGVGWDISIPSITIDTRWGVPRYDATYETEIYLLCGEQLITRDSDGTPNPMPHRTNNQTLRSSLGDNVRFYARTGDAHDSVIRHNTTTADYWWEVVDRNGVTHYYGRYPDSSLNITQKTTLNDDQGNVAKWMLAESRDTYGNWVRYYYNVVTTGGMNPGRQIYLEHIEYTGNNNERGEIRVDFVCRNRDPRDIPASCNLGFKEVTDKELCYIRAYLDTCSHTDVIYGTNYYFEKENTEESNFKTRLKSLLMIAKDVGAPMKWCNGDTVDPYYAFNHIDFLYYNAPDPNSLFSHEYGSHICNDYISAFMLTPGFLQDNVTSATALGLSQSSNWSIGGTVGVGLGTNVAMTTNSIGGNFHWNENSSESLSMLIDINGDGLADKVFVKNNKMFWRKQKVSTDSCLLFDTIRTIDGPGHFLIENGSTSTFGVQANVMGIASGSGNWSKTTSTTSTYFADVDGDGLVDIVVDGQVYFNRIVNNEPQFSRYKETQSSAVGEDSVMQQIICDGIIFDGEVDSSVACDRIWKVDDTLIFKDSTAAMESIMSYTIDNNHFANFTRDSMGSYHVIYYHAEMDCSHRNLAGRGVPNTESVRVWVAPDSGNVHVNYSVRLIKDTIVYKHRHADGVTYVIQHSKGVTPIDYYSLHSMQDSIIDTLYICDTCWNSELFFSDTLSIDVDSGDIIMFRLKSMNDKQFDNIEDSVVIIFNNETEYNSRHSFILTDRKYFEAPFNGHYTLEVDTSNVGSDITLDIIKPSSLNIITQYEKIQIIASSSDTNANWDNVDIRAKIKYWSDSIADTMIIWTAGEKKILHPDSCIWGDTTYQHLFGPLYNGWGQFTYLTHGDKGKIIPLDSLIVPKRVTIGEEDEEARIIISAQVSDTVEDEDFNQPSIVDFENEFGSHYNPLSESSCWVEMNVDAEHKRWVAFGAYNSIGSDVMSNTMQKEWYNSYTAVEDTATIGPPHTVYHDDAVPVAAFDGTPAKAILKVNSSHNQNYTGGVAAYNIAYSHGSSNIDMDYIDMNGDRYPDIVGNGYVQYRQQWGGLGNSKGLPYGINDVIANATNSIGAGFGASPTSHDRTISTDPANAKFTLSGDGSSINGNFNVGWDYASSSWIDINGDGLPDYVTQDGNVRLNLGYDFLYTEDWNFTHNHDLHSGMSASGSSSIDIPITNLAQGSIQVGAGLSRSVNRTDHALMDINGDGLPDLIWRNILDFGDINNWSALLDPIDSIHVLFNLGNGRWSDQYDLNIKNFNWSEAYNESLNVGATLGFTFLGIKATVGVNGTPYSSGTNRDRMQLVDVNGDGLPDLVTSNNEDSIVVRYNMGGMTNLLKKVTNTTGSEINLSYTLSVPDYMQPSRKWLLDTVTTYDPLNPNGGDTTVTVFEYYNPNYNRFERTSFGYGTVITKQITPSNDMIYRQIKRDYCNTNILNKGRLLRELTSDGEGNKYIEKEYKYEYASYDSSEVDTCNGDSYSYKDRIVTRYFEGNTHPKLTVAETYQYDRYHNVVTYIDEGDTAYDNDGIMVRFSYRTNQPKNLIGLRESYKIMPVDSSSALREVWYNYNPQGKLTKQIYGCDSNSPVYDFEYDTLYGNLKTGILPRNNVNQRMAYEYTYDDFIHTYPVRIENSFHEITTTTYNHHFGKPLTITDPGGNTMAYTYDYIGRLATVHSPMNNSNLPSVHNFYYSDNCSHSNVSYENMPYFNINMCHLRPYSITEHYDDTGALITRTVVITDGFGRVLQTKKGLTENGVEKMQVSGRTMTDAFGRTVRQYDPFTVPDTALYTLGQFETYMDSSATVTSYDILDRVTEVRQPLNVTTHTAYDIGDDADGHRRFVTTFIDPIGNVTTQYADYDGRQVQVTNADGGITTMVYDNLGQLIASIDPEGFTTSYSYDSLGRIVLRNHPDAGTTTYRYDNAGNIIEEHTPLGQINYSYTYYRLAHKRYSYMPGNNVTYTYDTSGNATGRLTCIVDGSGMYECSYDQLGNVIEEFRTIALPSHSELYRFRMRYQYDSWGRMLSMRYPDGEEVCYSYKWGGDLYAMHGNKNGNNRTYIKQILYNSYGQKCYVDYGNLTKAYYTYDALHRLTSLHCEDASGVLMQDIKYTFDGAGNITGIQNSAGVVNSLGGSYENRYEYDNLYRLVMSGGNGVIGNYTTDMGYTPSGRIARKYRNAHSVTFAEEVGMYYGYCNNDKPHAVRRIYDYKNRLHFDLRWDKAGNLGQISIANRSAEFETGRFLYWTEDNRMHTAVDDRHYSYYAYDHSGERRLKLTGDNNLVDVNADYMSTNTTLDNPTLYPSAYMVLTNRGYTKHYYAGAERVAARIGGGGMDARYQLQSGEPELLRKADSVYKQSINHVYERILPLNDTSCIMANEYVRPEFRQEIHDIPDRMLACVGIDNGRFKEMIRMLADSCLNEPKVFFYHGDHLGSASWITDSSGTAVQHLQYLPFGERYYDKHPAGYQERFTFTGKERDEETGYGYFGARYMDHELMTMWLSVDPLSDKYPSISPYAYCAWNPVRLVDPDGREINPVYSKEGDFLGNTKEGFTGHPLIMNKGDYEMMMDIKGANSISELNEKDVKDNGGITFDDAEKSGALSGIAQEKIVKNIISQYEDPELSQNYGFNAIDLASKINYDADGTKVGNTNFARVSSKSGKFPTMFYFRHNNKAYEFTVENITSSLVYHEWFGHDVMEYGKPNQMARASEGGTHYACYLLVMTSPLWGRTTPSYQEFNQTMFNAFFK